MSKIIFISGVHGSGKTTLGTLLSKKLSIPFASSSEIIKGEVLEQNWDSEKKVKDISSNQDILCRGIEKHYSKYNTIILDGHFTLLNSKNEITNVPIDTFRQLNLELIIFCKVEVNTIRNRLIERDNNTTIDVSQLEQFQNTELEQANKIAYTLNVPIIYFDNCQESDDDLISKISEKGLFNHDL